MAMHTRPRSDYFVPASQNERHGKMENSLPVFPHEICIAPARPYECNLMPSKSPSRVSDRTRLMEPTPAPVCSPYEGCSYVSSFNPFSRGQRSDAVPIPVSAQWLTVRADSIRVGNCIVMHDCALRIVGFRIAPCVRGGRIVEVVGDEVFTGIRMHGQIRSPGEMVKLSTVETREMVLVDVFGDGYLQLQAPDPKLGGAGRAAKALNTVKAYSQVLERIQQLRKEGKAAGDVFVTVVRAMGTEAAVRVRVEDKAFISSPCTKLATGAPVLRHNHDVLFKADGQEPQDEKPQDGEDDWEKVNRDVRNSSDISRPTMSGETCARSRDGEDDWEKVDEQCKTAGMPWPSDDEFVKLSWIGQETVDWQGEYCI